MSYSDEAKAKIILVIFILIVLALVFMVEFMYKE